ncbi:MAG: site-specific integrase [Actinomycetota bacterium]|nr:site-specific integrase [Actinomycetota bacterium]
MDPVDAYLARLGTAHSRRTVTSAIRCLERAHGGPIVWATFRYADALHIRGELSKLSWSWATTCWTVLRQLLVEARALGVVDAGLVSDVLAVPRLRGSAGRLGRDIDDGEIDALFDAIDPASTTGLRDGALLVLLALGGLRRSEAVAVKVEDWCRVTSRLTVVCGKGRRSREVPLPRWAGEMIDDWLAVHPGDGMLLRSVDRWGRVGGELAVRSVQYLLERLCARAGVPALSPHALRAHRITAVIDASDPLLAKSLAGHANVSTTARYDRRGIDHLAAVVDGMDRRRRPPLRVVS